MRDTQSIPSTKPYLIRALYEWCTDNAFTPFMAVQVDETVRVPVEFVKDGEIVLNVSFDATSALKLGDDFIEFKGRFGGAARDILVPVNRVLAIYARENGQGMAFPVASPTPVAAGPVPAEQSKALTLASESADCDRADDADRNPKPPASASTKRPALTRIK
jgi:stringent starvation protein B